MSLKATLVIIWACLIAGAAIASENHRICVEKRHAQLQELQHEFELLVVARVNVTN